MITKGAGSIRGVHSLNTRPGAQKQSDILRRMYILACEQDHLKNKIEWIKSQKDQTLRRLREVGHALGFLKSRVSEKEKEMTKGNSGGKFNSVPLTY
ncbi:MAG: hypothetical protein Q8P74_01515 [bacterium]|nr:hypothetical protein [bacterium]